MHRNHHGIAGFVLLVATLGTTLTSLPARAIDASDSGILPDRIERKLRAQWERYAAARTALLKQAPAPVSRETWEALLSMPPSEALTSEDIAELRRSQSARIRSARMRARQGGPIDLDQYRAPQAAEAFCSAMPKGGMLHIHPTGTLKRDTIDRSLQRDNPEVDSQALFDNTEGDLYADESAWLGSLKVKAPFLTLPAGTRSRLTDLMFLPPGTHPFPRFDAAFAFLSLVTRTEAATHALLDDFASRAASQGVIYAELTSSGVRAEKMPLLEEAARRIEKTSGVTLRFNRAFSRVGTQADQLKAAQALLALRSPIVTGIDLLGDETDTPALEKGQAAYATVLQAVRDGKSSLRRTMHAGELGDPRNPRDALILGAERLGHGVKLAADPVALEYAARNGIAVEINLVSNLRLRAIDEMDHHPFLDYLRLGLPVSLSTDDEGILDTDINTECVTAVTRSDITYSELKAMAFNSLRTSFADAATRERLEARLTEAFRDFERKHSRLTLE